MEDAQAWRHEAKGMIGTWRKQSTRKTSGRGKPTQGFRAARMPGIRQEYPITRPLVAIGDTP